MQPLRLPEGVPAGTAVFQLSFDVEAVAPVIDWQVLRDDERLQAQRFQQPADRVRFVCTRAALRRLLGAQLLTQPEQLRFDTGLHGKPQLDGARCSRPPVHFNVSHSGCHALVALSNRGPIGVDIERRDPRFNVAELSEQVFSERERETDASQQVVFFDRWTAKEAVLKALGLGVSNHLQQLSVLAPAAQARDSHYCVHYDGTDWPVLKACRLSVPDGYAAALAWTEASAKELP